MENNTNEKMGMKTNTCGAVGCGCGHHHMHIMKWLLKIAVIIVIFCFAFQMGELKGMLRSESMHGGYNTYGHGDMMMYRGGMMDNGTTFAVPTPATGTTTAPATK